jgi:SAM-dependent methyltransferase
MTWADYWDAGTTVYVSDRHKQVHYEGVARDVRGHVPAPDARVVDYGCGEALSAHLVADACRHLYLCDSSGTTRQRLADRYAGRANISVISPLEFEGLREASIDLIVANSVVQYLSPAEFERLLSVSRAKLGPAGRLVLADLIPRQVGALTDAAQLLRFAWANGFLFAAAAGLVRSFFSNYRRVRAQYGLLRFDEEEILQTLRRCGFSARRHHPNIGHNKRRMTFVATPSSSQAPAS